MSLKARLALATTAGVAVAVVAASTVAYSATSTELHAQVDATLRERVAKVGGLVLRPGTPGTLVPAPGGTLQLPSGAPLPTLAALPPPAFGGAGGFTQVVSATGKVTLAAGESRPLPVTTQARRVAAGTAATFLTSTRVGGKQVRVLTVPWGVGTALEVARPLDEVNRALAHLRLVLTGVCAAGIILAAAAGALIARSTLRPVARLTHTAEVVTDTLDLRRRIDLPGPRELAVLAARFNTMLAALEQARGAQSRLIADASHELRTPLTSLRTNIELFRRGDPLADGDRARLLRDVDTQIVEVTGMLGSLLDLARGEEFPAEVEGFALEELVADAVEDAAFRWPAARYEADLEPCRVVGAPANVRRAVANLLDNAGKWSPPGGVVEVAVARGAVSVRDHGPGIAPADLPRVWERFWRAPAAGDLPGSGLGLAIVRQVAEAHGASTAVDNATGGGACFRLEFRQDLTVSSGPLQAARPSS